jgi:hypothetical protein
MVFHLLPPELRMTSTIQCVLLTAAVLCIAAPAGSQPVNPDAAAVADFEKQVASYVQLRKMAESKLPHLRPTASREKIEHQQQELAHKIVKERESAKQGEIFSPPIQAEFRRLIRLAMPPGDASRVHKSLQNAEPVAVHVQINHSYPTATPLQSTPPSILLGLPHLPPDIEYRFVDRTLVLWDATANLVIDYISEIGP